MKKAVLRTAAVCAAAPLAILGASTAAAAPNVTAWDLGFATAVEVHPAPGTFCTTAPQGLTVFGYTLIPKVLLPPVLGDVGGVTVVCVPGQSGPVDVITGIGFTPLF